MSSDAEEVRADARGRGHRGDGRRSRYTTAMNNKKYRRMREWIDSTSCHSFENGQTALANRSRGSRRNQSQIENKCRITVGRPTLHCPRTIIMIDFRDFWRGSSRNTTKGKAVIESEPLRQLESLHCVARSNSIADAAWCTRVIFNSRDDDYVNCRWQIFQATFEARMQKWNEKSRTSTSTNVD